jgi:hypothetical protein
MKKVLLAGVALVALCGCTSMATRIKQQNYAYWPANIQQAVDNGVIIPGMNKLQVLAVTDVPESLVQKRTQFVSNGVLETWILYKSMGSYFFSNPGFSSTVIISFRDGVVDSVSF